MTREILTHPITAGQLREELEFFAQYFRNLGLEDCEALFGFAWGNKYYPTAEWKAVRLPLQSLVDEVQRVETAKLGALGSDDLFVSLPALNLEFHFCNDSDLHLSFPEPTDITEYFYQRWKERGFSPAEWHNTAEGQPSERLRIN